MTEIDSSVLRLHANYILVEVDEKIVGDVVDEEWVQDRALI
jgi:hypothetical protein